MRTKEVRFGPGGWGSACSHKIGFRRFFVGTVCIGGMMSSTSIYNIRWMREKAHEQGKSKEVLYREGCRLNYSYVDCCFHSN